MTLFVDMDEVIADAYMGHIDHYNQEFGTFLTKKECMGLEVWQAVPDHHKKSIRKQLYKRGFFRNLKPIAHSQEVLRELYEKYEVYIASAAMQFPNSLEEKSDWLDEHFPFVPWQRRILCGDKHILRGNILIDDRSHNLKNFKGRSLLFTSPHNINTTGFERVNNWGEVAQLLL